MKARDDGVLRATILCSYDVDRLSALEQHIPALRRYAFALLNGREDADDLVQGSLLRAIDGIETRHGTGDMRPWLFSIMHNLFVNQWRRKRVQDAVLVDNPGADCRCGQSGC